MNQNKIRQDRNIISPILFINYDQNRSMYLNWNFFGIRNTKISISNLFIFWNASLAEARELIAQFYSMSSFGDLIGIVSFSTKKETHSINWIQKSFMHFDQNMLKKEHIIEGSYENVLKNILPKFKNRKGLNTINLINAKVEGFKKIIQNKDRQQIEQIVREWKQLNHYSGSLNCNIILKKTQKNILDIFTNVNIISYSSKTPAQLCSSLKKYENSLRLSKIHLKLIILDKQYRIGLSRNQNWVNSGCTILEKKMYLLPAIQFSEVLHVCIPELTSKNYPEKIKCRLQLFFTYLDGNDCESIQEFQLYTDKGFNFHQTVNFNKEVCLYGFELHKDEIYYTNTNLSRNQNYLFLQKDNLKVQQLTYQEI